MAKRLPKIRPLVRRVMQKDSGSSQERSAPSTFRLDDTVVYNFVEYKILDFHNMGFLLQDPNDLDDIRVVSPQDLA
jgi:hypothetical protein